MIHIEKSRNLRVLAAVLALLTALSLGGPAARAQTRDIGVHGELLDRVAAIVNDGLVLKASWTRRWSR